MLHWASSAMSLLRSAARALNAAMASNTNPDWAMSRAWAKSSGVREAALRPPAFFGEWRASLERLGCGACRDALGAAREAAFAALAGLAVRGLALGAFEPLALGPPPLLVTPLRVVFFLAIRASLQAGRS